MQENRKAVLMSLMPISARLDDFLSKYEYIDNKNPNILPDIIDLMNSIQKYTNEIYKGLNVTETEWKEVEKEIINEITDNNDSGSSGFGKNDLGEDTDSGTPAPIQKN